MKAYGNITRLDNMTKSRTLISQHTLVIEVVFSPDGLDL